MIKEDIYTYPKFTTSKEKYEALLIALQVNLVKYETISSYKAPKSHFKIITYMNIYNGFGLLVAVFLAMIRQLGVLRPKSQDLVSSFCLG